MHAGLERIFHARSVALIGLSSDAKKMTGAPLAILQQTGFAGAIYPVNPRHADIGGVRTYARVADVPATPDVALIMLPASACARARVAHLRLGRTPRCLASRADRHPVAKRRDGGRDCAPPAK